MKSDKIYTADELRYLKMLARQYPTVQSASTEIINLQAIMSLPKGTEHFISDVHGEYEAFLHILNSCSGLVREKIDELFKRTPGYVSWQGEKWLACCDDYCEYLGDVGYDELKGMNLEHIIEELLI